MIEMINKKYHLMSLRPFSEPIDCLSQHRLGTCRKVSVPPIKNKRSNRVRCWHPTRWPRTVIKPKKDRWCEQRTCFSNTQQTCSQDQGNGEILLDRVMKDLDCLVWKGYFLYSPLVYVVLKRNDALQPWLEWVQYKVNDFLWSLSSVFKRKESVYFFDVAKKIDYL